MIDVMQIPIAFLASWRLTELILVDTITAPLRARMPAPIITCARCVSIWAGMVCTASLLWAPWLNWPLAMSWSYLFFASLVDTRGLRQQAAALFQENQALKANGSVGAHRS